MKIEYAVKRSKKRKKLTINIERDRQIVVLAPENVTDEKISQIIVERQIIALTNCITRSKYSYKIKIT